MTGSMQLFGVNLAGAEFGAARSAYGQGYTYPTDAEVDYYLSLGLNTIRLPFHWENLQPTLNGALDSAELARMDALVSYATSRGMTVVLDPHNYGRYDGNLIGSAAVPDSAFANFWGQLAGHYAGNSHVAFGLMNEPAQTDAAGWLKSANAAIGAIRAAGANQEVLVPGINYDGAWTWTSSPNASVIGTGVVDPAHNYAFEVHQYLDSDGSGQHPNVVSASVGVDRLTSITQWAKANGAKLFLGEFGVSSDATSLTAMNNMLAYMNQNADVWQGGTYWAGGPWWGSYMYSSEPQNGAEAPQTAVLDDYSPNRPFTTPLVGTAGNDFLPVDGSQGPYAIDGGGGTDFLGVDTAYGTGTILADLKDGVVFRGNTLDATVQNVEGVTLGANAATVLGLGSGTDLIYGGTGDLAFYGQGATDYIHGGTGQNAIVGGTGNTIYYSGGGTDVMRGGSAANCMVTGPGDATFYGTGGADYIYASTGNVSVVGGGGYEFLTAGSGTNTLIGLNTPDAYGREGNNTLYGGSGTDIFYGGVGTNTMYEGSGTDVFAGGAGTDFIYGGTGRSFVYGGSGTDVVTTGAGNQYVQAGTGQTFLNESAEHLTPGRFDQIDKFLAANPATGAGTYVQLPTAVQANTSFTAENGGTAIQVAATSGAGTSTIFVSNTAVNLVQSQTHFVL